MIGRATKWYRIFRQMKSLPANSFQTGNSVNDEVYVCRIVLQIVPTVRLNIVLRKAQAKPGNLFSFEIAL